MLKSLCGLTATTLCPQENVFLYLLLILKEILNKIIYFVNAYSVLTYKTILRTNIIVKEIFTSLSVQSNDKSSFF